MAPGTGTQQFGKYELLERIATGGMAEIFRARLNAGAGVTKPVVIKKILPQYSGNQAFVAMFINEAQIVARLAHGNIAQVFDFGELGGDYFLAMELVHGLPLSKVMRRARERGLRTLPPPLALMVAIEICKGLHYAHTRLDDRGAPLNIVHRDISPQNVLVSYEGQVKLVDFGIAKARNAGQVETQAGSVKGKYLYFAPEQARGKPLDGRTDVFAAGIVLYEMLCGRMPFEGKMVDVLAKIVRGQFPRPRVLNPELPIELEQIVLQAMATDREQRYPSAQAMQEALAAKLYANAPTFSTHELAQLMHWLFESELLAEGLTVEHAPEFLDWIEGFKNGTHPGALFGPGGRPAPAAPPLPATSTTEKKPQRAWWKRKWLLAGAPLAAMVLGAALVFALGQLSPAGLSVTSVPAGASLWIDGQKAPSTTPLRVSGLRAGSHHLELTAPGYRRWRGELTLDAGQQLSYEVRLEAEAPPADLLARRLRRDELAPAEPEDKGAVREVRLPAGEIDLFPAQLSLLVPPSRAARIRLDPAKTYQVSASGEVSSGSARAREVLYFLDATDAVPANARFGALSSQPRTITGATALYGFVLDAHPEDNRGTFQLRLEADAGVASTLDVDAKAHALNPALGQRLLVTGLDPAKVYDVELAEGSPKAVSRAGEQAELSKVAVAGEQGWQVLEVGRRAQLTGTSSLAFTFPDDAAYDNGGSLRVRIVEAPRR